MDFNGCPYQNLFSLDLNVLREGASTTSHGNKFQAFTTLFENTFARTFSLDRFLNSLRPLLHCHIGYQISPVFWECTPCVLFLLHVIVISQSG